MTDAKPMVPVNPAGLDEVAKSLLEEYPDSPLFTSPVNANIRNPEAYLIMPGKTYGNYSYPDLLVAMERTNLGSNWNQSHEALHQEDSFMLSIRQYIDFLQLLKSENVYDGKGAKLTKGRVNKILDEILTKRGPWRAEWLDAYFKNVNGVLHINYEHRNVNGQLKPQRNEPLEDCVMKDAYVNLFSANRQGLPTVNNAYVNLLSANRQGLPTVKSRAQEIYYWHPVNGSLAWFRADSRWVALVAVRVPTDSSPSLGVRAAKIKM